MDDLLELEGDIFTCDRWSKLKTNERRTSQQQRIVLQFFLGAQALGLVQLVEKDASKLKTNERRTSQQHRIVSQFFLGAQALGLVRLVEKDASKLKMNERRTSQKLECCLTQFRLQIECLNSSQMNPDRRECTRRNERADLSIPFIPFSYPGDRKQTRDVQFSLQISESTSRSSSAFGNEETFKFLYGQFYQKCYSN